MKSVWIYYLLLLCLGLSLVAPLNADAFPQPLEPAADAPGRQPWSSGPVGSEREPVRVPAQPDTEFVVAQAKVDYFRPSVAVGGMVVWYARGARDMDILGLKLLSGGTTPGETTVIADGSGNQEFPFVANDAQKGGYLVVWHDLAGKDADIYGRYLDKDGHLLGDPFAIVTAKGDQLRPTSAYVPAADGYLVVWQDGRAGKTPDIFARLVPSYSTSTQGGGTRGPGKEFAVTTASGGQFIPTVACEASHPSCLVTWQDNRFASTLFTDVVGQLVDASAAAASGSEIQIAVTTNFQYSPTPVFNPVSAEYLVVWDDDISARRVSLAGVPQGNKIQVSLESPSQFKPTVAVGADGTYLVVWEDLRNLNTRGADLYGQWLSSTGRAIGANFALSTDRHDQYSPALVSGNGWGPEEFFLIWEDDRTAAGTLALYGEWISPGEGE